MDESQNKVAQGKENEPYDNSATPNADLKIELKKWEKNILGVPFVKIPTLIPGLLLTISLLLSSIYLSNFIGIDLLGYVKSPISSVMLALLFGMIISNILKLPPIFQPGIKFSVKKLLRVGIIMLGIRLSMIDFLTLGIISLPIIIVCITSALVITHLINKKLDQPKRLSTLIAVGTSICGVSAIVATSPAIGANEEETTYAVAVITIFGLIATITYPFLGYFLFNGDPIKAGLWLGTAIHDTSQVTGAALVYSQMWDAPLALDTASVAKLIRNMFMVVVIPLMVIVYSKEEHQRQESNTNTRDTNTDTDTNNPITKTKQNYFQYFPKFILGFILLSLIRTLGDFGIEQSGVAFWVIGSENWSRLVSVVKTMANNMFIIALAGVGLTTQFKNFKGLGIKPFIIGLFAAISTGVVSFVLVSLLGGLI